MIVGAISVILVLISGGLFSFDYVRDAADKVIEDKDRAKQVVSITKQADEAYETFSENLDKLSKQFVQMNQDYQLTRQEVGAFSIQTEKNRMAFLNQYVELRFQVIDLVTAEEWQAMHVQGE